MLCSKYEESGLSSMKVSRARPIPGLDDQNILEQKVNPKGKLFKLRIYLVVEKVF